MRSEYDFSKGVRGKYHKRVTASTNVIVLDPDVAKKFKTSKAVNAVLRTLLKVPAKPKKVSRSPTKTASHVSK